MPPLPSGLVTHYSVYTQAVSSSCCSVLSLQSLFPGDGGVPYELLLLYTTSPFCIRYHALPYHLPRKDLFRPRQSYRTNCTPTQQHLPLLVCTRPNVLTSGKTTTTAAAQKPGPEGWCWSDPTALTDEGRPLEVGGQPGSPVFVKAGTSFPSR